jgi:hypothetical protein
MRHKWKKIKDYDLLEGDRRLILKSAMRCVNCGLEKGNGRSGFKYQTLVYFASFEVAEKFNWHSDNLIYKINYLNPAEFLDQPYGIVLSYNLLPFECMNITEFFYKDDFYIA